VSTPNDPPPPPPLRRGGVGFVAGGVGVAAAGVGPEVTALAQAAVPAETGAVLVARVGSSRMSAVSVRFWSSVTVSRSVMSPTDGASREAVAVLAPEMVGGFEVGATTTHE
jgi:hypothetical protein